VIGNIAATAQIFVEVGDLKQFPEELSTLFCKCLTKLSLQCPIISTLLALVFKSEPEFADLVVEKVKLALLGALTDDNVLTAKLALRALACLANCGMVPAVGEGSVAQVLTPLLDAAAAGGQSSGPLRPETSILLYLSAHTVVYFTALHDSEEGKALLARAGAVFDAVLASYSSVFTAGGSQAIFHAYAAPVDNEGNELSNEARGVLSAGPPSAAYDSLYDALRLAATTCRAGYAAASPVSPSLVCPWLSLGELLGGPNAGSFKGGDHPGKLSLSVSSPFLEALNNVLASGAVGASLRSPPHGAAIGSLASSWLFPRFAVLDSDCGPEVQALLQMPYEVRAMLVGYLADVLHFFEPVINDDGTHLGTNELLCKHLNSTQNLLHLTKQTSGVDFSSISIMPLLIELLMQLTVELPADSGRAGKVFRVILELSRQHQGFAPLVAASVAQMYNSLGEMDATAMRLLAKWLSMHMINTQLAWPYWSAWVTDCEEEGVGSNKVLFCRLVVDHLGRALVGDTVRSNVPQQLHDAMPANPTPSAPSFAGQGHDLTPLYDAIFDLVDAKVEGDDLLTFLETPNATLVPAGLEEDEAWRSSLVVSACISSGGSVPSAVIALLDRYSDAIRSYSTGEAAQAQIVKVLSE